MPRIYLPVPTPKPFPDCGATLHVGLIQPTKSMPKIVLEDKLAPISHSQHGDHLTTNLNITEGNWECQFHFFDSFCTSRSRWSSRNFANWPTLVLATWGTSSTKALAVRMATVHGTLASYRRLKFTKIFLDDAPKKNRYDNMIYIIPNGCPSEFWTSSQLMRLEPLQQLLGSGSEGQAQHLARWRISILYTKYGII